MVSSPLIRKELSSQLESQMMVTLREIFSSSRLTPTSLQIRLSSSQIHSIQRLLQIVNWRMFKLMYPRKSQIFFTQLMIPNKLMLLRHSHQDTQRLAQSRLRFIILMTTMIGFLLLIVRSKRSSHSMSLMASLFGNKPTILMARRLITSRLFQPWLSLETQKSKNSPIQFSQIVIRSLSKLIMARN